MPSAGGVQHAFSRKDPVSQEVWLCELLCERVRVRFRAARSRDRHDFPLAWVQGRFGKLRTGFDKPVLSEVEGLSPNGDWESGVGSLC
jgi:hypothetical protein